MVSLVSLWIPIVVSALFVFLVSSVLHMALTYHRADYKQLPNEAEALESLRRAGVAPGYYVFPYCATHKEMGSPEVLKKYEQGPVGILSVLPNGLPKMGKHLSLWFGFVLLVSVFAAYLAGRTLGAGTPYLAVFRVAGTAAFLAYGVAQISESIWRGQPWPNTFRAMFDGLVYALVTGGTFGWLWPR